MNVTHPGDAEIVINGETHRLRLTLGALAEMEEAFGGDFTSLTERFQNPKVADLLLILHALLRGGGAALTLELLKASDVDFAKAAAAIGRAFRALDPENPAVTLAPSRTPGPRAKAPGAPQSMMEAPGKKQAAGSPGANGSPPPCSR